MSLLRGHVAIVDDDQGTRRALSRLLEAAGFRSTTYSSAEEYLESRDRPEADCLVLDVHLGGISGFDLRERLAASGPVPPVIFITAHEVPAYPALAAAGGAQLLLKPIPRGELVSAVQRALPPSEPEAGESPPAGPIRV